LVIAVRCRYNRHMKEFENAGADIIIDEETLVGQTLSQRIVEHMQEFSGAALVCGLAGQDLQDASS
jgi:hypothetical protein